MVLIHEPNGYSINLGKNWVDFSPLSTEIWHKMIFILSWSDLDDYKSKPCGLLFPKSQPNGFSRRKLNRSNIPHSFNKK